MNNKAFDIGNADRALTNEQLSIAKQVFDQQHERQFGLPIFEVVPIPDGCKASFPLDFFSLSNSSDGPRAHIMYTPNSPLAIPADATEVYGVMVRFAKNVSWSPNDEETSFDDQVGQFIEGIDRQTLDAQIRLLIESGAVAEPSSVSSVVRDLREKNKLNTFTHILIDSEHELSEAQVATLQEIIRESYPDAEFELVGNKKFESEDAVVFIERISDLQKVFSDYTGIDKPPFILINANYRDSFIVAPKATGVEVFEDPAVGRSMRVGFYGWIEMALFALDNRRVVSGHF